jgi:carbon-monoxide dehydrogenase catalytic subunit
LKPDAINVAVHGHNPVLSEVIVAQAMAMKDEAIAAGAPAGFNLVGICCTGMEVMMRHGIPTATNSLSQELAIATGALDAAVVDYQCIMPSCLGGQEVPHRGYHDDADRQDAGRPT